MPARRPASIAMLLSIAIATAVGPAVPPLARPLAAQTLTGTVYDSTLAAPLAGAKIVVSGTDRIAITDTDGRFRLDDVAPGEYVVGFFHSRLDTLGIAPRGRSVRIPADGAVHVALAVPSPATIAAAQGPQHVRIDVRAPSVVVGRVLDAATEAPVPGAAVRLAGTHFEAVTDTLGWFAFPEVPGGDYRLEVEHIGYGTQSDSLTVPSERTVEVVFRASTEAIALEPLEVTVLSEAERLRRSSGFAGSMYITRDEIEEYFRRGALHIGDVLRMHRPNAVWVRPSGPFGDVCVESTRRATGARRGRGCQSVAVVVDGVFDTRPVSTLGEYWADGLESVTFLPPLAATTRYGVHGARGVVELTTRWAAAAAAAERPSGEDVVVEMREALDGSGPAPRWKHWLIGGAIGAGAGVGYIAGRSALVAPCRAGQCERFRPADIASSMLIGAAVGWLAGEIGYRFR